MMAQKEKVQRKEVIKAQAVRQVQELEQEVDALKTEDFESGKVKLIPIKKYLLRKEAFDKEL